MSSPRTFSSLKWGVAGTTILTLASFGGGASRRRGGLAEALGLDFVTFGHGRNLSIVLYWIGIFLLVAAWIKVGKSVIFQTTTYQQLRTTMWVWIAPLLLAGPVASRDVYSYLMQGAMVRDGFDPYTQGAAINPGPYLLEVSHDWRNTTTPYGPLHLLTGKIVTLIVGDNVTAGVVFYKVISVLGFAAIAWAIPRIATELGGNRTLALWLGVANPVMIIHLIAGMHNEAVMVALVSVGLLLALQGTTARTLAGIALIALGVSLKATAFLAMPFVLWLIINRYSGAKAKSVAFLAGGAIIVAETLAVLAVVTAVTGVTWGWIAEISGNSKVINPLALPTLITDFVTPIAQAVDPGITYNAILATMRQAGLVCMLVGLVVVWWLARGGRRPAIFGTIGAYQVAFVFNAVTLPWYYASAISLLGVASPPRWLIKLATGASLVVAVGFAGDGNHQLYNWWWMAIAICVAWLSTQWLFQPRPAKTPKPAPA